MLRIRRAAIAIALTLAFGAVPLVADWCAASCEAARSSATAAGPACHHAGSPAGRIGHLPVPCGQGHIPVVVDGAATAPSPQRTPIAMPASAAYVVASVVRAVAVTGRAGPLVDRSPSPLPLALASALRL
jgi:hypothetical protein